MPIKYTLTPTQLDCVPEVDDKNDVVVKVHWAYTGTNGTKSAGLGGTTQLEYDPAQHDFTPYSELTLEQVTDWVLSSWSQEQLESNRGIIDAQLNTASPALPWGSAASVEETVELFTPPPETEEVVDPSFSESPLIIDSAPSSNGSSNTYFFSNN